MIPDLNKFDAVIYDMDGVLTDSEPIWKDAMEQVFASVSCPLTRKDFEKTVGLRIDEVVNYWYAERPWEKYSARDVEQMIVDKMVELLNAQASPLPGVERSLNYFREKGKKIGLATSSYVVLIDSILDKLSIRPYFDFTHSAELEPYGKPHPIVYLSTAQALGVDPLKCLVIEDSLNGIIAGKAARMQVICVPEKSHAPNPKLNLADWTYESLDAVVESMEKRDFVK